MQPLWWTKKQTTKEERWKLNVFVHSSWKDIFESNIHILFERQVFCQNLEVFFGSRLSSKWHDGERASRLPYWTNISHGGTNISQILDKYITRRNKYITNIGQIYHTAERPTFSLGHHPFLFILQIPILICWSVGKQQWPIKHIWIRCK